MKAIFSAGVLFLIAWGTNSGDALGQEQYMSPGASVQDYRRSLLQSRGLRPRRPKPQSGSTVNRPGGSKSPRTKVEPDIYHPPESSDIESSSGVSVQVFFAHDSALLTAEAKSELDKLGQALADPEFSQDRWFIEGHTDASGSAEYNEGLSQRRAYSVMSYLVEKYGIRPDLLIPVGKGESEPYDRSNPYSNINRRVRVKPAGY